MTAIDACHLLAPSAVAAEARPAAAANNPCPSSAFSAVNKLALADWAATSTCNMNNSGRHLVTSWKRLVACGGWLTIVNGLGRSHVHRWGVVMHGRGMMSRCLVMYRWIVLSVVCHMYYFIIKIYKYVQIKLLYIFVFNFLIMKHI